MMSQPPPDPPRWRIVATDDDPKLLAQVTYALRQAGHIVYAAYNGFIALQQACTIPDLDLLITNTRLRNLGAAELIRQVRETRPGLPILHIGEPLPKDDVTGNVPTLQEPVTSQELLEAVAALLGRS
jgi:DNA-binding response OmpR family regulator